MTRVRMNPPQAGTKFGRYGPGFRTGAALGAIEWWLRDAEKRLSKVSDEVLWLREVREERDAQVRSGEWPPEKFEVAP